MLCSKASRIRPNTMGPWSPPFRELNHPLIPLISMNCSHSKVRQKKGGPKSQRIPIRRWQNMSFIVPMGNALPGGKSRVCALQSPSVIRGRPPGMASCAVRLTRHWPSSSHGRHESKQSARGFYALLLSGRSASGSGRPGVCANASPAHGPALNKRMAVTPLRWPVNPGAVRGSMPQEPPAQKRRNHPPPISALRSQRFHRIERRTGCCFLRAWH